MRKQGKIYLCEGYFDVASADDQGLACAGYTGANITQAHVRMLAKELNEYDKKFTVMFAPDNDEEGQKRIEQIRDKFREWGPQLNVRVVKIPDGYKDFSDLHQAGTVLRHDYGLQLRLVRVPASGPSAHQTRKPAAAL